MKKNNLSKLTCTTLVFISLLTKTYSQVSSYTYAQSNSAYTAIAAGTVQASGAAVDDNSYTGVNIGFTFKYNCVDYTQISINANGFIALGSAISSSYNPISSGSTDNIISALSHDMQGKGATSRIRTELTGAFPNRVFVIQWENFKSYLGTAAETYNFQIRLSETSNLVEVHYGSFTKDATNKTVEIGLRGSTNTDFKNLSCTGAWTGAVSGATNTATVDLRAARIPASGQKYSFTPSAVAMSYTSSTTVDQALGAAVEKCASGVVMSRIEVVMSGGCNSPVNLTQVLVNMTGTASTATVSKIHIYYTGTNATYSASNEFVAGGLNPAASLTFNATQALTLGTNYFWIVYDFNNTGTAGTTIGADMPANSLTISGTARTPTATPNCLKTYSLCAPGPGGVSGTTLWLKSDAGTSTTTNNAGISSWTSQATSPAVTVTQATAGLQPTYKNGAGTGTNNRFNYNPFIYTDGTSNNLNQTGDIDLGNTATGVSSYQAIGEDLGIVSMDWYHTSNGSIKMKGDGNLYINRNDGSTESNRKITPTTLQACVTNIRGACGGITSGRSNGLEGTLDVGCRVATQNGISIGSNLDNGEYMQGGMGEYIVFPSTLNATDNLKVESYLAIKYGVTLGTSASVSHYLSSDATQIWTGTAAYQNRIIGIGRDDISTLLQKQSHNYDDTVRIYKGTLSATNTANATTFSQDKSFVISGENTGKLSATISSNSEIPTGLTSCSITSRLEREWRIAKTNFAETFHMDIKLNNIASIASVNVAHLRLLVDDDGNFANGGTQCYYNGDGSGIVITYSNPTITVSNIANAHIPNNATRFITIASVNPSTPLPVELLFFDAKLNSGKTVDLTWETIAERDNDYFTLDKSVDGINWEFLATINAAGTTTLPQTYVSEDLNPAYGMNYYRLKQTDFNGEFTYADIRTIELKSENDYFLAPNPCSKSMSIYGLNSDSDHISIYDNLGKQIHIHVNIISKEQVEINTENFANGVYYVQISSELKSSILKVTVFNK